jgi:hypothetical protein
MPRGLATPVRRSSRQRKRNLLPSSQGTVKIRWWSVDISVWKSVLSQVIAASQLREMQEAMLLMRPGDWVQTSTGFWQLIVPSATYEPAGLVRIGERVSA